MRLERTGDVFVLTLGDTENRFNPETLAEASALLRQVRDTAGPRALVTAAEGKFWSNGLDLEWVQAAPGRLDVVATAVQQLFIDFLEADFVTVAALQGHAFAAGAMLALSHDLRVMRSDRGWICLPEVDIRMTFTPGMNALLSSKLSPHTALKAMVLGHRFTGPESLAAGIVDELASEDRLLDVAIQTAAGFAGKHPESLSTIRSTLYAPAIAALRGTP